MSFSEVPAATLLEVLFAPFVQEPAVWFVVLAVGDPVALLTVVGFAQQTVFLPAGFHAAGTYCAAALLVGVW